MGIQVEFNPYLTLRAHNTPRRLEEECLPEKLIPEKLYRFLKKGQRNYWLEGEIPLLETKGNQQLSRPLASITIVEAAHYSKDGEPYTRGVYQVNEVFDPKDSQPKFNGFERTK